MAETFRMVCLANSRKRSGRCVAGKARGDDGSMRWIRPISARPDGEISFQERRMAGREPALLDIIEISLSEPRPHEYQTENWLLDSARRWVRVGGAQRRHLERLADAPSELWRNGWSTPHGLNDRVPMDEAKSCTNSLALVRVDELSLGVFAPGSSHGDPLPRVQAIFAMNNVEYAIRVTDPAIEKEYLVTGSTRLHVRNCYLTVSLGEPYNGYCYKLVAAIFL